MQHAAAPHLRPVPGHQLVAATTTCLACGATLDTLATITERQRRADDPFQTDKRAQIRTLKRQEELAASRRMAELYAEEEARLADLRARQLTTTRREQRLLRLGLILAGAAIFVLIMVALVLALL